MRFQGRQLKHGVNLLFFLQDHPSKDCFNLTVKEDFRGRNKSEIDIQTCFAWTLTEESPTSGMAMLVVDIPSGYIMLQPDANR